MNNAYRGERITYLPVYLSINQKLSSVALVAGSQSLFAIFASLLHQKLLDSSASSLFPLPFPNNLKLSL